MMKLFVWRAFVIDENCSNFYQSMFPGSLDGCRFESSIFDINFFVRFSSQGFHTSRVYSRESFFTEKKIIFYNHIDFTQNFIGLLKKEAVDWRLINEQFRVTSFFDLATHKVSDKENKMSNNCLKSMKTSNNSDVRFDNFIQSLQSQSVRVFLGVILVITSQTQTQICKQFRSKRTWTFRTSTKF